MSLFKWLIPSKHPEPETLKYTAYCSSTKSPQHIAEMTKAEAKMRNREYKKGMHDYYYIKGVSPHMQSDGCCHSSLPPCVRFLGPSYFI